MTRSLKGTLPLHGSERRSPAADLPRGVLAKRRQRSWCTAAENVRVHEPAPLSRTPFGDAEGDPIHPGKQKGQPLGEAFERKSRGCPGARLLSLGARCVAQVAIDSGSELHCSNLHPGVLRRDEIGMQCVAGDSRTRPCAFNAPYWRRNLRQRSMRGQ